jgi:predicted 3-demethylubiquinone-9 3-methyltransferase (glyoxalase superfamily)
MGRATLLERREQHVREDDYVPVVRPRESSRSSRILCRHLPNSHLGKSSTSSTDTPSGPEGQELTVEFTVCGRNFLGLNGGPKFVPNKTVSFIILTEDQTETDRLWNAIVSNGGQESACGWCKDRWGFSWQITPRALLAATTDSDRAAAKRAMNAMMTMRKIDIAAIEAARAKQ